jgi:hypothetical protein
LFRKDGWEYYRATESRKNLQGDVQVSYQEVERDMTKARAISLPIGSVRLPRRSIRKEFKTHLKRKERQRELLPHPIISVMLLSRI